jgi:hypothetical protein
MAKKKYISAIDAYERLNDILIGCTSKSNADEMTIEEANVFIKAVYASDLEMISSIAWLVGHDMPAETKDYLCLYANKYEDTRGEK